MLARFDSAQVREDGCGSTLSDVERGRPSTAVAPAVTVTRVGTRVVVRLAGVVGDDARCDLDDALRMVEQLAVRDVMVDLDDVHAVSGAGLAFLVELGRRWDARVRNAPADVRRHLTLQAGPARRTSVG